MANSPKRSGNGSPTRSHKVIPHKIPVLAAIHSMDTGEKITLIRRGFQKMLLKKSKSSPVLGMIRLAQFLLCPGPH